MRVVQVGAAVAAVYLGLVVLAWLFQRRLIYLPMDHRVPPAAQVLPGAEEVRLTTDDGLRLGAWWIPARQVPSLATVVFCNGNAGNRSYRAPLAAALTARGMDVLLFDYRGYGGNPGSPSEDGLVADLRAAVHYVEEERGVPSGRIVYFGESLGAAVALSLAVEEPPAGLILRSPFTSMVAVGRLHYPFLPVGTLLHDRYPNVERVARIGCPLLVLAGDEDQIVPQQQSRAVYAAAGSPDKRFVGFPGADHNSAMFLDGDAMLREVAGFIRRVAKSE